MKDAMKRSLSLWRTWLIMFFLPLLLQCDCSYGFKGPHEERRVNKESHSYVDWIDASLSQERKVIDIRNREGKSEHPSHDKIPSKSTFLPIHKRCNAKGNVCRSIENFMVMKGGIILSIVQGTQFPSGAIEQTFTTTKIDFSGKILFSYQHQLRLKNIYFLDLGTHYIEVVRTQKHQDDTLLNRIYIRDAKTGRLSPTTTFFQYPQSKARVAYDSKMERIIVPSADGRLFSLNKKLVTIWTFRSTSPYLCSPAIDPHSNIYTCLKNGHVLAVDREGQQLWSKSFIKGASYAFLSLTPKNTPIVVTHGSLHKIDTKGQLIWEKYSPFEMPAVSALDGRIWLGSSGGLVAYSSTGKRDIRYSLGWGKLENPPLVLQDGTLLVLGMGGILHFSLKDKIKSTISSKGYRIYGHDKQNPIVIHKGYIYTLAVQLQETAKEGLLKIPNTSGFTLGKGWSTAHGAPNNHRQFQ